jgi:xanthine/CO dehydrogenase XdhC/CoxF family maturation factor
MNSPLRIAIALLALNMAGDSAAQAIDSLLRNSPFGNPGSAPASADNSGQQFEFRGVVDDGGNLLFSVYEPATRRSRWLAVGESSEAVTVRSFDAQNNSLTIEHQARTLTLALRKAPPSPNAPRPPVMVAGAQPQAAPVAAAAPAAPPENAQRLQQIAEEIRRRRALRQQTTQGNQPNPPPSR